MQTFIKSLSFAAALALSLSASTPAAAFSVALKPLHPHNVHSSSVAVIGTCRTANSDAAVNGTPFFEMPAIAEGQGATGTSGVAIRLDSTGSLQSESILQSSGNPNL